MPFSRFIRTIALLVLTALLSNQFGYAAKKPFDTDAIKTKLEARGVGRGVRVTLTDKTEQKGLIVSIGDQSFSLKPRKDGEPIDISYSQITGVHRDKLSTGQKVGITLAVVAVGIGIAAAVLVHSFDKSFSKI